MEEPSWSPPTDPLPTRVPKFQEVKNDMKFQWKFQTKFHKVSQNFMKFHKVSNNFHYTQNATKIKKIIEQSVEFCLVGSPKNKGILAHTKFQDSPNLEKLWDEISSQSFIATLRESFLEISGS